jgi:hypothetical protein
VVVGVFSALGIAFLLEPGWLLPMTTLFLVPAVVVLWRDGRRRRSWLPLWLGVLSAGTILIGKFHLESGTMVVGGMVLLVVASIWSALPAQRGRGGGRMAERIFEVFSAGCAVCDVTVDEIRRVACSSCEVRVLDMNDPEVAERARSLGVRSVPAVVVDGRLADCCSGRGVDLEVLKGLGLGKP